MVRVTRFSIFIQQYKKFPVISKILNEYFESQGKVLAITPSKDSLGFIVHFDLQKIPHKPPEESKKLFNQIYSSDFHIALCKHGFLMIDIENPSISKNLTPDAKEFFRDITSRLEAEIKGKRSLWKSDTFIIDEKSSISFDTGILYFDQDIREIVTTHLTMIEKRYSDILLKDLYAQFLRTDDLTRKSQFARSFGNIKEAISTYVNKLDSSPSQCKLVKTGKDDVRKPIEFLERLCIHLKDPFEKFTVKKTQKEVKISDEVKEIFKKDIKDLIEMDETLYLEIKATMKFDLDQQKPTDIPTKAVVKAIAGFMNSYNGGVLIVGYDQRHKKIIGLETDYPYTKTKDWDGWLNFFMSICNTRLGKTNTNRYIKIHPVKHEERTLAKILVRPIEKGGEVYVDDEFFLRSHGQTITLKGRELQEYLRDRCK